MLSVTFKFVKSRNSFLRRKPFSKPNIALASILSIAALKADAHVKWFAACDPSSAPLPIGEVLTDTFVYFFFASVLSVFLFFLIDRHLTKSGFLKRWETKFTVSDAVCINMLRVCACIFFASLWVYGLFFQNSSFLTPELKTEWPLIPWLQLLIAVATIRAVTLPLAGLGIFILFGFGVQEYGSFHMTDYMIFLGIAYFFTTINITKFSMNKSSFTLLYILTGLTLLWSSIEKFGYPQWTFHMLDENPGMLMGMSKYFYMVLAGYIEFNIVFMLLGASSFLFRIIAIGLNIVFLLAIVKFGLIDAIGHLMIIGILWIMFLRGAEKQLRGLILFNRTPFLDAIFMTAIYHTIFVLDFTAYYGFHCTYYK